MTGVTIPMYKKGDRKKCTNYQGIALLILPGKVYAKRLVKKCRKIVKSKSEDGQYGYRPGRSITDQIFTSRQIISVILRHSNVLFKTFYKNFKQKSNCIFDWAD